MLRVKTHVSFEYNSIMMGPPNNGQNKKRKLGLGHRTITCGAVWLAHRSLPGKLYDWASPNKPPKRPHTKQSPRRRKESQLYKGIHSHSLLSSLPKNFCSHPHTLISDSFCFPFFFHFHIHILTLPPYSQFYFLCEKKPQIPQTSFPFVPRVHSQCLHSHRLLSSSLSCFPFFAISSASFSLPKRDLVLFSFFGLLFSPSLSALPLPRENSLKDSFPASPT
ncbi:hypothetical protein L873DRAFT_1295385 [Choiromyces venosus 120613-1]|uniref:Uncharacterized protein n=1 Tax=Choiromyces venosus 120613-1 TaxID=1336337 RepID=A0A3N4JBQ4_9PEZI|nr:hypothetical protein L873DRAFT_1295385 [Choiromyces venosus 120613-1]